MFEYANNNMFIKYVVIMKVGYETTNCFSLKIKTWGVIICTPGHRNGLVKFLLILLVYNRELIPCRTHERIKTIGI